MWMVVIEIWNDDDNTEYWYYGTYDSRSEANEVADSFIDEYPLYHIVLNEDEAKEWGVLNLPY